MAAESRRGVRGRRLTVIAAAALAVVSSSSASQVPVDPLFQLQSGLTVADFSSAPDGTASTTAFTVRFLTRLPVRVPWFQPVIGASFTPYGSTGISSRDTDAPTLFGGNVFTLLDARRGNGWFTVELPLLIAHRPGAATGGNVREYGRDLIVQPTVYLHLGRRALQDLGAAWGRFDLFAMLEQNLTPNRDAISDERDRFNPLALIGASLTIGGPVPR